MPLWCSSVQLSPGLRACDTASLAGNRNADRRGFLSALFDYCSLVCGLCYGNKYFAS